MPQRQPTFRSSRHNERGAALISTLLISTLLLIAGGTLILTTSMSGTSTVDTAAEAQAYYSAEAGLQAALNVMRGNVMPNPLFAPNPPGKVATENKITFLKAKTNPSSNLAGDPTTPGFPARLSRWINYNYTSPGSTYADRVGISPGYNPYFGGAYSLKVIDAGGAGPPRLVIESTGYGPRGARKTLSLLIISDALNIDIPAMLVMRGHDDHVTNMNFQLGNSNAKKYSGVDKAGLAPDKPAFALSAHDTSIAEAEYAAKPGRVTDPKYRVLDLPPPEPQADPSVVTPTPWFLRTANDARAFLALAESLAQKKGRVVSSLDGAAGAAGAPEFIVVKGDCNLDGGAGLLIVEGDLTMKPAGPDFHGIILILGKGTLNKTGGGNRNVYGAVMIARFGATGDFLEPTFNYGVGAGTSSLQSDSQANANALELTAPLVLGVVEK